MERLDKLPELLTVSEAGEVLGLSRSAAYRAVDSGFLPTVRISKTQRRVPKQALLDLLRATGATT